MVFDFSMGFLRFFMMRDHGEVRVLIFQEGRNQAERATPLTKINGLVA